MNEHKHDKHDPMREQTAGEQRDSVSGGQRNADVHTESGAGLAEQQTSSGQAAERDWHAGKDTAKRDTPLKAGDHRGPAVEGGYDMGTTRGNTEDGHDWKAGGENVDTAETTAPHSEPGRGPNNPRLEAGNAKRETEPGYQDHKHEAGTEMPR